MSASPFGAVSGVAFVDSNGSGAFQSQDFLLPGVNVTLTGTTAAGATVSANTQTDGQGSYAFSNVLPGSYQITFPSVPDFQGDAATGNANSPGGTNSTGEFAVGVQQSVTENIAFGGLSAPFLTLSMFLNTSTSPASYPVQPAGSGTAGSGSTFAGPPSLVVPIPTIHGVENTSNAVDLDAYFGAPKVQNTTVEFDTSKGSFDVQLFNADAPITAANFLAYAESGSYNGSIFHRETSGSFIQGGGFALGKDSTQSSTIKAIDTAFPAIGTSEFNATTHPRFAGTLALALAGNSGTNQWFFNLKDNTSTLAGNYTVFGHLVDASGTPLATSPVLQALAAATPVDESTPTNNGNFQTLPLAGGPNGGSGGFTANDPNFPADAAASNFDVVTGVKVISPKSYLTYTAVSSNPALVVPTVQGNMLSLPYTANQTGTATITVTATDPFGETATTTFQVTVAAPPTVLTAPIAPDHPTGTTSLTVNPTGSNGASAFTYQWLQSSDNGATFHHVSALTQANQTLTLPTNLAAGAFQFEVLVTPNNGTNSAASTASGPTFTSPRVTITSDGNGGYKVS